MLWFFGCEACGILVPWPGIKRPTLEGEVLTTGLPGKSLFCLVYLVVLGSSIFSVVPGIFGCGMWNLVPWPRIEPRILAWRAWSPSHWTTREIQKIVLTSWPLETVSEPSGVFRRDWGPLVCTMFCGRKFSSCPDEGCRRFARRRGMRTLAFARREITCLGMVLEFLVAQMVKNPLQCGRPGCKEPDPTERQGTAYPGERVSHLVTMQQCNL